MAPQLVGGVFEWCAPILAFWAGIATLAVWWESRHARHGSSFKLDRAGLGLLLALLLTGLHLVPLPVQIARVVTPFAVGRAEALATALGTGIPPFIPVSVDVGATQERLVYGAALLATFCCGRILSGRRGPRSVLVPVAVSVTLIALVTLLHAALGADRLFGVYTPRFAAPPLLSPLLNANHFAGYLSLGAPIILGLAIRQTTRAKRVAWLGAAALVVALVVVSRSRGGIVACVTGLILFGVIFLRRGRTPSGRAYYVPLVSLGVVVLGLAAGGWSAAEDLLWQARAADSSKLRSFAEIFGFVLDEPWVGVGRGGFGSAFASTIRPDARQLYPENIVLQYTAEFGIALGVIILILIATTLLRALVSSRRPVKLGAVVGLAALCAQNLVDFSLELTGVGVVAAAVLGAVSIRDARAPTSGGRFAGVVPPLVATSAIALALVPGLTAAAASTRNLSSDLMTQLVRPDATAFQTTLRRALASHPSEPVFAVLAGAEAMNRNDPSALRWLNLAMYLEPGWTEPHLLAAQVLRRRGLHDQALLELRAVAALSPEAVRTPLCELLRAPSAATVLRVAPALKSARHEVLEMGAVCLRSSTEEAEKVDAIMISEFPTDPAPHLRRGYRLLATNRFAESLAEADQADRLDPNSPYVRVLRSAILMAQGKNDEAVATLRARIETTEYPPHQRLLWRALAHAHAQNADASGMRTSISEARSVSRSAAEQVEDVELLVSLELTLGNRPNALEACSVALILHADGDTLATCAELAESLNATPFAYRVWSTLCEDETGDVQACKERDRLSAAEAAPTMDLGAP